MEAPIGLIYRTSDLVGCGVFTETGDCLGHLVDVMPSGGNDIFVVQKEKRELLIPALKTVVRVIDIPNRRIEVVLPAGLLDVYEK